MKGFALGREIVLGVTSYRIGWEEKMGRKWKSLDREKKKKSSLWVRDVGRVVKLFVEG